MFSVDFIPINVVDKNGTESTHYVNVSYIKQIYVKNDKIIIELDGYDTLELAKMNIDVFMDRFKRY